MQQPEQKITIIGIFIWSIAAAFFYMSSFCALLSVRLHLN